MSVRDIVAFVILNREHTNIEGQSVTPQMTLQ